MLEVATLYDGSYQECKRVSGVKYNTNYCYLMLKPGKNASCSASGSSSAYSMLPMRLAVCLPDSCNQHEIIDIFNQLSPYPFTACHAYCSEYEVKKDTPFWGFSIFLIVMVVIALAASLTDYIRDTVYGIKSIKERNVFLKILLSFSLWTNAELLLSVKEQKPGFIKSLDCIRLFSMCWVVTGHSFIYLVLSDTFMPVIDFPKHFWNHLLLNAFVSVDTFFVLSGLVLTYMFFKTTPKKKMIVNPVTWIMFYVHRYLRLTPPIMLFIGFFTVYAPYIQGPFSASQMNQLVMEADECKTTWWQNLLYINDFASSNSMGCYGPTWYLAVDTQLYLVAPIVLIGLYFSFAVGTGLIVAGCVGSIITTYILFSVYNLPADMFGNGSGTNFFTIAYEKPWVRCPPYLVGMLTGYLLAVYGNRKIRLNWVLSLAGWIIAVVIAGFCLFATYDYDKGSHWSVFTRGTFYNFHRLGWGMFICWVVAANHMGWGGPIDKFMSHPIWQPFGRLSYCAYIVHWVVLFWFLNVGGHATHYYSALEVFTYTSIPATFLSYIFAFFWSCLFEIPTLKLEKMLIEAILGTGRPSNKVEPIETGKTTPILEKKLEGNGWIEEVKEEKFDENTKV
ncbi:Nose resistant-to-fluoxetine protein N-terminal domain-containing protein [Caenorhabditis elegans]|nr:Nose resistant-to-fluoxetine protein N-terminal domain-containing protein [Caenorhabditis elegans]CTQ87049.1 Nose resistant-to-fluoxetine protein N-terminal domain-containing protein [Caenorhabditis elegans]|eukprot:NP_001300338.1 O-ACyltransferase homolog [Caenorhabditis elegans]